jgi:hypothetical protein
VFASASSLGPVAVEFLDPGAAFVGIAACRAELIDAATPNRSPDTATPDEVRRFQLYLIESGASICNRNRIMTGGALLVPRHAASPRTSSSDFPINPLATAKPRRSGTVSISQTMTLAGIGRLPAAGWRLEINSLRSNKLRLSHWREATACDAG